MKALVYHGPMDVRIDDKPKPKIEHQEDIILKVIKTARLKSSLWTLQTHFKSLHKLLRQQENIQLWGFLEYTVLHMINSRLASYFDES